MTEFSKIKLPELSKFLDKKKIYYVRNLYLPQNATDKYKDIFFRYWKQVEDHLEKLETAGKVSKIFCESIYMSGDEALKVLNAMNLRLEQIVKKKIEAGARLIPLENREIFGAYIDWNNCLMVVRTSSVYKTIYEFFQDAIKARFEHIKIVLKENIGNGEAGMLVMRDEDRESLQLPEDMELFTITPPAYDDLQQYIRDRDSGEEYWRTA